MPEIDDIQPVDNPDGVEVRWLPRGDADDVPGVKALEALHTFTPEHPATLSAYVVGEQALATGGRRHLVAMGVPKSRIEFVGYWRIGKAAA